LAIASCVDDDLQQAHHRALSSHTGARWLAVALPLLAACQATPAPAPKAQSAPSIETETVSPVLPALQILRLAYTFQAAELVQREWPLIQPDETCLMLVEPEQQWVINCELPPAHFTLTTQTFRNHPIYVHAGGGFESAGRSVSPAELLATTPAAAQVPAGGASHALPGAKPWLVVGSLEALTRFHPAFEHATTEAWVSVVMHELVHTHQLRAAGSERFLDAIVAGKRTPDALTALFGSDQRFRTLIEREYALLVRAAQQPADDKRAAKQGLARWLAHYQQRTISLHDHPNAEQLIADDALFSYIEGVARYVESQFLAEPSLQPQTSLATDPRFDQYAQFRDRGYAGSPNRQLDQHYFYAIGYHLCVLLDRVDSSWRTRVHSRDRFLYDLVRDVAANAR
jgi:hypothetical protein